MSKQDLVMGITLRYSRQRSLHYFGCPRRLHVMWRNLNDNTGAAWHSSREHRTAPRAVLQVRALGGTTQCSYNRITSPVSILPAMLMPKLKAPSHYSWVNNIPIWALPLAVSWQMCTSPHSVRASTLYNYSLWRSLPIAEGECDSHLRVGLSELPSTNTQCFKRL